MERENEQQIQHQQPFDQQQQLQPLPDLSHLSRIPNLMPINSKYNFQIVVPKHPNDFNIAFNLEYKMFVKANYKMTMNVLYKQICSDEKLFVRAMLLFANPAETYLPVVRCANHRPKCNSIKLAKLSELRSKAANIVQINDPKATYLGREDGETFIDRLSILVPLESNQMDESGRLVQPLSLEFSCQKNQQLQDDLEQLKTLRKRFGG